MLRANFLPKVRKRPFLLIADLLSIGFPLENLAYQISDPHQTEYPALNQVTVLNRMIKLLDNVIQIQRVHVAAVNRLLRIVDFALEAR